MPFLFLIDLKNNSTNYYNAKKTCRKEEKVDYISCNIFRLVEKASVSASGSITVEAAVCIPLFLYASICLIWILEIKIVQSSVKNALQAAGKELAVELCEMPFFSPSYLENKVITYIGEERLERSSVSGGVRGIHCEKSYVHGESGVMELKVQYRVELPAPGFVIPPISQKTSIRVKSWVGYEKVGISHSADQKIVYITETGVVYHEDYDCSYLNPSIRVVSANQLEDLRSNDGSIYYPCSECMEVQAFVGKVYITDYGNRYHSKLDCSGLKRRIYAVPLSEVGGRGGCSKCAS